MTKRDSFSPNTRKIIFENSGFCCAFPECHTYVKEAYSNKTTSLSGYGQGAHIYDASKKNNIRPRAKTVTAEFVKSAENGLLLCANHHILVDSSVNKETYTAELLFLYKRRMEAFVKYFLESVNKKTYSDLTSCEKRELELFLKSNASKRIDTTIIDDKRLRLRRCIQVLTNFKLILDMNQTDDFEKLKKVTIDKSKFEISDISQLFDISLSELNINTIDIQKIKLLNLKIESTNSNESYVNIYKNLEIKHLTQSIYLITVNLFENKILKRLFKTFITIDFESAILKFNVNFDKDEFMSINTSSDKIGSVDTDIKLFELLFEGTFEIVFFNESMNELLTIEKNEVFDCKNTDHIELKKIMYFFRIINYLSTIISPFSLNEIFILKNHQLLTESFFIYQIIERKNNKIITLFCKDINRESILKNKFYDLKITYGELNLFFLKYNVSFDDDFNVVIEKIAGSKMHFELSN